MQHFACESTFLNSKVINSITLITQPNIICNKSNNNQIVFSKSIFFVICVNDKIAKTKRGFRKNFHPKYCHMHVCHVEFLLQICSRWLTKINNPAYVKGALSHKFTILQNLMLSIIWWCYHMSGNAIHLSIYMIIWETCDITFHTNALQIWREQKVRWYETFTLPVQIKGTFYNISWTFQGKNF